MLLCEYDEEEFKRQLRAYDAQASANMIPAKQEPTLAGQ
jgi:hypothetical protein